MNPARGVRGRINERSSFDPPTRLRLIEGDLDSFEQTLDEIETRIGDRLDAMQSKIDAQAKVLVGILISLTTACLLLVVNILAAQ